MEQRLQDIRDEPAGSRGGFEPTLADRVTEFLSGQIRKGIYPVNARLPTEKFMTEQFGVSRTVIREAISRLKSEGLVESRQGSGTVVLDPASAEVFRLGRGNGHSDPAVGVIRILELRRGIEAEMAALAAVRRTDAQMADIRDALAAIDRAVDAGGDGVEEDLAFHIAVSRATGNPHYTELLGMLTRSLRDAIRLTRGNESRRSDLTAQVRMEHAEICAAIDAQDAPRAREAAFLHMRNTEARISTAERDFWTGDSRTAAQRLAGADLATVLRRGG
ncbi:FadR/GntR family transcriptional regulator [Cupriavidus plantarum]|uniref:FadR/GntR family transcriptional regulator n=1 Tax=Cupriavidus plantarum TaxID=942865 RepID=UPI000E25248D|nr:FadR/GntR family transcriptional regulator [Cupriavidus plantarum]REE90928.1 GntR family transcriptional regulator [Cupriavidus plantarum]RLK33599.1 GntR family transcriptional regulator [Cupriavidus plantarum]CAG2148555.1 HTH-type transcriptional repressor NanR [Cupriavidus plantarum]SMR85315.1 transcriptional regulator, GntR family [Cupriavidus plantarum]